MSRFTQDTEQTWTTALSGLGPDEILRDPARRGIWVEAAIGSWLCAAERLEGVSLFTWREGDREVDFVVTHGDRILAIEVKSGRPKGNFAGAASWVMGAPALERASGLGEFLRRHPTATPLLVGEGGVSVERFLSKPVLSWLA